MALDELLKPAVFLIFSIIGISLIYVAIKLWLGNRNEYSKNRLRSGKKRLDAIRGDLHTAYDGNRDFRVAAGLAVDTKKNEWKEQGRLSDEAVNSIYK